jgi:hypothetical protein
MSVFDDFEPDEPTAPGGYVWTELRDSAIRAFAGQTPRADDEKRIVDVFVRQPQLVQRAVDGIAAALAAGRIKWAWSALRSRVEADMTAAVEAVADGKIDRAGAIVHAERYLRRVGFHFVTAEQVLDELFGERSGPRGGPGPLYAFAGDADIEQRMLDLWRELEPVRLEVEAAAVERARAWRAGRDRLDELDREAAAAARDREREAAREAARAELETAQAAAARRPNPFLEAPPA